MLPRNIPKAGKDNGPRTFELDNSLPKLPIPSLEESLRTYKEKVIVDAFIKSEDERKTFLKNIEDALKEGSNARVAHEYLTKRRWNEKDNYFTDWWVLYGYLSERGPLVPIEGTIVDFPLTPQIPQLLRAALVILSAAKYHDDLQKEHVSVSGSPGSPMCMRQFRRFFQACRIPGSPFDSHKCQFRTLREFVSSNKNPSNPKLIPKPPARYCVLGHMGRFFKIYVDDPIKNVGDGSEALDLASIYLQIKSIADTTRETDPSYISCGLFTGGSRERWAEARSLLRNGNENNTKSFDIIEGALFVVTLDYSSPVNTEEQMHDLALARDPSSRWHEHASQFMIFKNGYTSYAFEHSMFDGAGPFRMNQEIGEIQARYLESNPKFMQQIDALKIETIPTNLKSLEIVWKVDASTPSGKRVIELAQEAKNELLVLRETCWTPRVKKFTKFGKNQIKRAKVSPDSFVQMAFQLAYARIYNGKIPSVYESVITTKFMNARTECGRSVSKESVAFVEEMIKGKSDSQKLVSLLQSACNAHSAYIKAASNGMGIDRHFFAIKMQCLEMNIEAPAFLNDPVYKRASCWDLSTSHAYVHESQQGRGAGTSFRPVDPNSIGLVYAIRNDCIDFTVMTQNASNPPNNSTLVLQEIERALEDMLNLFSQTTTSKL